MPIVDRDARNRVAAEVRRYLDGETSAFEFDEAIFEIESDDPTVSDVIVRLWGYYDDHKDHHVVLSKSEWDYFQRLLLILESDHHVIAFKARARWLGSQLLALLALISFATCAWRFGLGQQQLLALAVPCGVLSMGIGAWRRRTLPKPNDAAKTVVPFASFAELRATYASVGTFRKTPYRKELAGVRIRSPSMNGLRNIYDWIVTGMFWFAFSPAVLCYQVLPQRDSKTRVAASA